MRKWGICHSAIVIALGIVAWYASRPERLVVNQTFNEAAPGGQASSAQTLASPTFHSVLHPTEGRRQSIAWGGRNLRFTNFRHRVVLMSRLYGGG